MVPLASFTVGELIEMVGVASSSSKVKAAPVTLTVSDFAVATALVAVPVTVVLRFASSKALSTAVMVTVSDELVVSPAAISMVVSAPTV